MQLDLTDMVPKLKKAAEDTEAKMKIVATEKGSADILAAGNRQPYPCSASLPRSHLSSSSLRHLERRGDRADCSQRS